MRVYKKEKSCVAPSQRNDFPSVRTHVFLLPLAEVDLEGRHGELLAHAPLVVNRLRDQGGVLRAVTAGRWGAKVDED